jgi:hypothetical protein
MIKRRPLSAINIFLPIRIEFYARWRATSGAATDAVETLFMLENW